MEDGKSRWRKLAVTVFLGAALCVVHAMGGVNWEVAMGVAIIDLGFVSADTLDKAFQTRALGNKP